MSKLIPLACAAVFGAATAQAQQQPADSAPVEAPSAAASPSKGGVKAAPATGTDGKVIPQVTVSGGRQSDMDERRNSTAGKQIYGREELDRNGDTSLGDVLKRLPGVTIGGRPGRGGDVRMRGLGNGYTQILLNGERPPAGFSMESLSPDQVERVEVMRGPVAEHSARAIAGTINIVLRDGYQQRDIQVKLTDSIEEGLHSPNLSVTLPGKAGAFSYTLSGSLGQHRSQDKGGHSINRDTLADGSIVREQLLQDESSGNSRNLHFTPRFSYKFDNGDTLNIQPFLMASRGDTGSHGTLDQSIGKEVPDYNAFTQQAHSSMTFLRGFGNWIHKLGGAAKLDVKFGGGIGKRNSDSQRTEYDGSGKLLDRFTDTDSTRDRNFSTGGKYTSPLGQGHLLAAGWDLESSHREQTKVSVDKDGKPQFAESGDNLNADTRRVAFFAQDEWDITPQWAVYMGARWEGIRTSSERRSGSSGTISNTSKVFSPLLHGVWRIPGFEKDQVRMSLTKSYKSPNVQDLIAAPTPSRGVNRPDRPDRVGNPDLKPELATGLDIAYEHYLGRNGIVSVSGFVRDIDNLIRREVTQKQMADGLHWVSMPTNVGHARTSGIELEAKFSLRELMDDAPNIDFRSNYSRFWSKVDGIPGPDNRLDQQAKQTANLGLDYRMKDLPLTLGGSYNWTPSVRIQTSQTQSVETGPKRVLDLYALWKFDARTQLRFSASNLLAEDSLGHNLMYANGLSITSDTLNPTYRVWSIKLETKF